MEGVAELGIIALLIVVNALFVAAEIALVTVRRSRLQQLDEEGHRGARRVMALVEQAVRANIRVSANHLRHGSQVIEQLIHANDLVVVGAEYSLDSGLVDFFDGTPGV